MVKDVVVVVIGCVVEVMRRNWRYEEVLRAIKREVVFGGEGDLKSVGEEMERVEKYVLGYGMKGNGWRKKE
ncbi:hypothetical protein, partial [Siminovitchia fortis]|uniref:hypothetical protein n=1 Tax=Siminovitchia fortis TaxID=254758 RepID=UPI0011A7D39C